MTLNQRRLLYIIFIILFLIVTPILWLYASGYKLGSGFKFQKTGILILDSEPKEAKIILNNKPYTGTIFGKKNITTPAKIKNLLPDIYTVRLEKNGYWPWEKKLEIKPGESTFAEDIVLFRNEIPLFLSDKNFEKIYRSPSSNLILLAGNNNLMIVDLKKSQTIATISNSNNLCANWSPDSKYLTNCDTIYEAKNLNPVAQLAISANKLDWQDNNTIFFINENGVNKYLSENKKIETFFEEKKILDLKAEKNYVYILSKNNENSIISILEPNSPDNYRDIKLPLSDYYFQNNSPYFLDVYDKLHDILYLVDPSSSYKPIVETIVRANINDWINENQIVYSDGHEIWLYDLQKKQKILISRYSSTINKIFWHPSKNYIVFSTDTYIATLELDKRDKYNVTYLIKDQEIKDITLSHDGSRLLFIGKVNGKNGVFELILQ